MGIPILVLTIICAAYAPYWIYGIITDKEPVRTDSSKLDKMLVVSFLAMTFLSCITSIYKYFA